MRELLFEGIAFGISTAAFLYGLFKIYIPKTPFYFKMIVSAVGCYALEELWEIVNVICGIGNSIFSIRLIGIFGCFCTFLAANAKGLNKVLDEGTKKSRPARIIAFAAPLAGLAAVGVYSFLSAGEKTVLHILIAFIVILPAIIDSYFELKYLLLPNDEMSFIKYIRPINVLVILEYIISFSYFFVTDKNTGLITDVISALIMAILVFASERGAAKWKTLI